MGGFCFVVLFGGFVCPITGMRIWELIARREKGKGIMAGGWFAVLAHMNGPGEYAGEDMGRGWGTGDGGWGMGDGGWGMGNGGGV